MRRFSQRNQLVTLNDINITPLLDLAFVLLIIFIITTPLLDQAINLRLPVGGSTRSAASPNDVVTAEVNTVGKLWFRGRPVESAAEMENLLRDAYRRNTNLVVRIRADAGGEYRLPVNIIEMCRRNGITRFDLATEAPGRR